ncbi:maleylpyruvate isomerase family mycothiol-dependent enzyme [Streptomyces sp. NPDC058000]|uniref:maleylpyruvate isomerase family mycothiol-dependent enzyme n=1 Tax=Streptomyces sp. NPDC058000 TaxID=3346299 RepID=UPI0036E6259A
MTGPPQATGGCAQGTGPEPARDPELPGRLLRTERDALLPLLRATPTDRFALRTACPGWTVRDVLAHCGAALVRLAEGRTGDGAFRPEANAADVAARTNWPLGRILDELEQGFGEAGPALAADPDGRWDTVALGEWVHAGDVRAALGVPGAYGGAATALALPLLAVASRRRETPRLNAQLADGYGPLMLGNPIPGRPPVDFRGDTPTLIRLYSGRPLVGTRYALTGGTEAELSIYR